MRQIKFDVNYSKYDVFKEFTEVLFLFCVWPFALGIFLEYDGNHPLVRTFGDFVIFLLGIGGVIGIICTLIIIPFLIRDFVKDMKGGE